VNPELDAKMNYSFRLRFRTVGRLNAGRKKKLKIHVTRMLKPIWIRAECGLLSKSEWLTVKSTGYRSEAQAKAEGEKLRTALILSGVIDRFGVDCGADRATASISSEVRENYLASTGYDLRNSIHGLDVFKSGAVRHFGARATAIVLTDPNAFETNLGKALNITDHRLSERQLIACVLLNDSLFVQSAEAAFVMRVSATEALCEQRNVSDAQLTILDVLTKTLHGLHYLESDLEIVAKALSNARRQGVRSAYMAKIRSLLSPDDAKAFDKLYAKRGQFVHDGLLRGELQDASSAAFDIATRLLLADIVATPVS
jgi:hypothetical protein